MRRIKIRQLEALIAFMKTDSVTDAAEMLATTQPNASKLLKQTEDMVGIPLFTRSGGRLRPTPEAEILYGYVARLMDGVDMIERLSLDLANLKSGFIRIACLATFGLSILPPLITRFNARHPGIPIELDVVDSEKIHTLVGREYYDFGVVHRPQAADDLQGELIGGGRLVCLVRRDHPLAAQDGIGLKDLATLPLVTYPSSTLFGSALRRAFDEHGVRFPNAVSANHSAVVRKLFEHGCGDVAIVEAFSVWGEADDARYVVRPLEPGIPVSMGLIVPSRRPLSLAASAFIESLREAVGADPVHRP